ncbi:hypothetical protein [Amycolatopsis sp.]|uniref:hypothetical protein n=1 Tax=Amycolatopsis sp. TaxID=37632 RepID=UPI002B758844|nr:hypothetical protein [Amycolatopsis sp.]HVV12739.1 hypothetical protein [Amycolatopsis sp.]
MVRLERHRGRVRWPAAHPLTGQAVQTRNRHRFFWVPIAAVAGVGALIVSFTH